MKKRTHKKQGVNLKFRKAFQPGILTEKREETLINDCTHHHSLWSDRHINLHLLQQLYQIPNKSVSENSSGQS